MKKKIRYPHVERARKVVHHAVRKGLIVRPTKCEKCGRTPKLKANGKPNIQAHHHDYSKPLEIEWVCPNCHAKEDPRLKGVECPWAVLNDRLVRIIRKSKLTARELSAKYGINVYTIKNAKCRNNWKHVK